MRREQITPELLRALIRYEPETGRLFWLPRPRHLFASAAAANAWNARWAGVEAFTTPHPKGYLCGKVNGVKMLKHRVAWAVSEGRWPSGDIDHEDHDRVNNRRLNLRDAGVAGNNRNLSLSKRSTTGVTGVNKVGRLFEVRVQSGGKRLRIGSFRCVTAATLARKIADREHGYHANHGKEKVSYDTK